jgi:hypothetical protein
MTDDSDVILSAVVERVIGSTEKAEQAQVLSRVIGLASLSLLARLRLVTVEEVAEEFELALAHLGSASDGAVRDSLAEIIDQLRDAGDRPVLAEILEGVAVRKGEGA